MINAAIVGMGRWGRTLVNSVADCNNSIEFVAGTTRTLSKATNYAAETGIRLHATYEDVLADDAVHAVVLASPHTVHFDQIMAAAEAGKHVFCEKPFCLTGGEARLALDTLAAKGLKVAIGHNRRFSPNAIKLKQQIDSGELGDLIQIEGNFSANMSGYSGEWRDSREESPVGGMTSLGIHAVDMYINLFGRVSSVLAVSRRVAIPFDIDDATGILMDFENGQVGYLGTVAATGHLWQVRAFGTRGWGSIYGHNQFDAMKTDGTHETLTWDGYEYPGIQTIKDQMVCFAQDCEGGNPFPATPDQILHATLVLEAIIKSVATGERVTVG
ncbi:MAG: putative oxidoreductase YhhX [Alphaproteobacteria bacterium MarineAlpha11_Bin1]|nr:MAG: putative oxidoreductase YhhX [Alphaproteobacteria bacterium MarineAlpha11_Bin1]|tara:strand:- start:1318 stop:2301 length:984 start_codon:yes stop_codon:yes gene_type:complete